MTTVETKEVEEEMHPESYLFIQYLTLARPYKSAKVFSFQRPAFAAAARRVCLRTHSFASVHRCLLCSSILRILKSFPGKDYHCRNAT